MGVYGERGREDVIEEERRGGGQGKTEAKVVEGTTEKKSIQFKQQVEIVSVEKRGEKEVGKEEVPLMTLSVVESALQTPKPFRRYSTRRSTPRSTPRRMSVESAIGRSTPSNHENVPPTNRAVGGGLARREKEDTASAVKKRIRAQQSSMEDGGSFFSTSPGTFLRGGGPMMKKQKV